MGVYVVSAIVIGLIILNYFLSIKLYSEPKNSSYFNNVTNLNFSKNKYITPVPRYVVSISILLGLFYGIFLFLANNLKLNKWVMLLVVVMLAVSYISEITRKIIIRDDKIILSKAFSKTIQLYGNEVKGMYIYSYNKKFLKKNALTTKLVITTKTDKKYKFVLSSLSNKSVLNMMSEAFGITENKMFIGNK